MKQLRVTIEKSGATTIAVECVVGTSCQDLTARIERALGQVTSDSPTDAMYQNADAEVNS